MTETPPQKIKGLEKRAALYSDFSQPSEILTTVRDREHRGGGGRSGIPPLQKYWGKIVASSKCLQRRKGK